MQQQNSSSRFEATERSVTGDTITIIALAGQLDARRNADPDNGEVHQGLQRLAEILFARVQSA